MTRKLVHILCCAMLASLLTVPAQAVPIIFTDRGTFDGAAPGLIVEDFENTLVAPGAVQVCGPTISSTSNDACFAPGGIVPGISFGQVGSGTPDMVVLGAGFLGNPSTVIGPNTFQDNLDVMFMVAGGANAIGLDILNVLGFSGDLIIDVFGTGGLIASTTLTFTGGDTQFWGILADEAITQVLFNDMGNGFGELIDNVAFGSVSVPEPGTLALLGLGLIGMGLTRRRKKV